MIPGWIDAIDAEVRTSMRAHERFSPAELAAALGVAESCAVRYITLLAETGRLRIAAVSVPCPAAHPAGAAGTLERAA
jgi:hypothetical protein